jgi:hypothetical protein
MMKMAAADFSVKLHIIQQRTPPKAAVEYSTVSFGRSMFL